MNTPNVEFLLTVPSVLRYNELVVVGTKDSYKIYIGNSKNRPVILVPDPELTALIAASETNASNSENNASNSETNASNSEAKAAKWAEEEEDVEVTTGKYSAKHYSLKAEDYKDSAAASAAGAEADAIQLLRLHNPDLVFSGFVNTSTAIPSHVANKAYIATASGTIFGITGVVKGQVIEDDGSAFKANSMSLSNRYIQYDRGDDEYLGDSTYALTGIGVRSTMVQSVKFDNISFKAWTDATGDITVKVFISDSPTETNFTNLTEIASKTIPSGMFNIVANGFQTIHLGETLEVAAGKTIHVFMHSGGTGDITIPRWTSYAAGRVQLAFAGITSDIWTTNWSNGSYPAYLSTGIKLTRKVEQEITDEAVRVFNEIVTPFDNNLNKLLNQFDINYEESYDSKTVVADITSPAGGNTWGSPFRAWGAMFNVQVGVSFNLLRIPIANRSGSDDRRWAYAKVIVKNTTTGDLIATSPFVPVNSALNTVTDLEFPLLNPEDLSKPITLDDTSFSGSTFFIAVQWFDEDKSYAFGGYCAGTMDEYAGLSYYQSNAYIDHVNWSAYYGNPCVCFEWYLADNLQITEILNLIELQEGERLSEIENRLTQAEGDIIDIYSSIGDTAVRVVMPEKYYAVVGQPIQIFFHGLIESVNPYKYNIVMDCDIGKTTTKRMWYHTPVTDDIGNHTFTLSLYDDANNLKATASTVIEVVASASAPTSTKNVLCVGDSLGAGSYGSISEMVVDGTNLLSGASSIANIDFVGVHGEGRKKWVAYGGQIWGQYNGAYPADPTTADVWLYAAGHDKTEADDQESIWEDSNSNQWQLETVSGYWVLFKRYGGHTGTIPTSPNALTHVSNAIHTGVFNYTNSDYVDRNPFWDNDTSVVSFIKWFEQMYNDKYTAGQKIDYCYVLLGWNQVGANKPNASDHATTIAQAKTFIDNFHRDYPLAKFKILGLQYPSLNGGLGANYGASSNYLSDVWATIRSVQGLNLAYQELCNSTNLSGSSGDTYASFCEFINISGQFDSENNMPEGDGVVNLRSSKTEKRGINGVHPATEGYRQIGDAIFRNLIANL